MCFPRSFRVYPIVLPPPRQRTRECSICLEPPLPENTGGLPCGHGFCASCILKWLEANNSCPLCRFKVRFAEKKIKNI